MSDKRAKPGTLTAVVGKELSIFFDSPIAYIVGIFFLLFAATWTFFIQEFFARDAANFRVLFSPLPFIFIGLIPALTMRSWADERRQGSYELLLTLPVTEWTLVAGKYLATLAVYALMLVCSTPIVLVALPFGNFDGGVILGQYLGIFLYGAAAIALSQCVSGFTRNQISAFFLSVAVLAFLTFLDRIALAGGGNGPLSEVLLSFAFVSRYSGFERGIADSRDVIFFLVIIWGALFVNRRVLLLGKWS